MTTSSSTPLWARLAREPRPACLRSRSPARSACWRWRGRRCWAAAAVELVGINGRKTSARLKSHSWRATLAGQGFFIELFVDAVVDGKLRWCARAMECAGSLYAPLLPAPVKKFLPAIGVLIAAANASAQLVYEPFNYAGSVLDGQINPGN